MEPLLKQLRELPSKFAALPSATRWMVGGGAALIALVALLFTLRERSEAYEYAFTNLTPEDSAEAASLLRSSQVPFRIEANGAALAVPSTKVYDVRLLLATAGLPRGGGVGLGQGFELFDKGDLGASEFTLRTNLGRALEGELGRTISRLPDVRSARVHLALRQTGLYRDDDLPATASVYLNMHPGRTPTQRQLSGIRHLVASAVPGLSVDKVAVIDGRGAILAGDERGGQSVLEEHRQMERDLEERIIGLLEPVVGPEAVYARVTAVIDDSEVSTNAEVVDPDQTAVRNERTLKQTTNDNSRLAAGTAGAAANNVLANNPNPPGATGQASSSVDDQTRNYEVSRTVTQTRVKGPRIKKLSVSVVVNDRPDRPRPPDEIQRLTDAAKRAVGFDAARRDEFNLTSIPFASPPPPPEPARGAIAAAFKERPWLWFVVLGLAVVLVIIIGIGILRRRREEEADLELLRPGAKVGEIEAQLGEGATAADALPASSATPALIDPAMAIRDRARELVMNDPVRAAHLLRAWLDSETEPAPVRKTANG